MKQLLKQTLNLNVDLIPKAGKTITLEEKDEILKTIDSILKIQLKKMTKIEKLKQIITTSEMTSDVITECFNIFTELEVYIEELEEDSNWLYCLEQVGVDNWEGYDIAQDMYEEQYGED